MESPPPQDLDFRPAARLRALSAPLLKTLPGAAAKRATWAYLIASAAHLWLGDAWQLDWLVWDLLYLAGMLALWRLGPALIGWLLCAIGALGPLLFARDVLTQSLLLAFMAMSAAIACVFKDQRASSQAALQSWRGLTVVVYGLATLHKLNADFLNPAYSCAHYGLSKVDLYWGVGLSPLAQGQAWLSWLIIATELSIAGLLALGLRRVAWPVAIAFHIPLTLTMAPAFVWVMLAGHSAYIQDEDASALRACWRAHKRALCIGATALMMGSQLAHRLAGAKEFLPTMALKEWALWLMLAMSVGLLLRAGVDRAPSLSLRRQAWPSRALVIGFGAMFLLNGLLPYSGLKAQHAGAMLSNLRVDEGCWNSIIFPERARLRDDYVRINAASFGHERYRQAYEAALLHQLWSPPQLRQMRRNWCNATSAPIMLSGTYKARPFKLDDLCDSAQPWPFEADGIFGVELFPDALRFQKNLERRCPQACIH